MTDKKTQIRQFFVFAAFFALTLAFAVIMIRSDAHFEQIPSVAMRGSLGKKTVLLAALLFLLGSAYYLIGSRFFTGRKMMYLIVAGILLSGLYIAVKSPVLGGYDESSHLFKVVATLDGKTLSYDSYNYEISDSYFYLIQNNCGRIFDEALRVPWATTRTYVEAAKYGFAQPTYPAWGYVFNCIGLGIGELLRLSTGMAFLLGRLTGLLGYAGLILIAMLLLPKEKPRYMYTIALFALMPGTVYVAAHYGQDGTVYGLLAIMIALFLKMYEAEKVSVKDYIVFSVILILMAPLKLPYLAFGFLLFLIPGKKYSFKHSRLWIIVLAVIVLCFAGVWTLLVNSQFQELRMENVNGKEQVLFILTHIPKFLMDSFATFCYLIAQYLSDAYRIFGFNSFVVSQSGGIIFSMLSIFAAAMLPERPALKTWQRILVLVSGVLTILLTTAALYASYNPVGAGIFYGGIQCRYYYGLLMLLPLCMPEKFRLSNEASVREIVPKVLIGLLVCEMGYFLTAFGMM